MFFYNVRSQTRCVTPTFNDWYDAMNFYLRPNEVRPITVAVRRLWAERRLPYADALGYILMQAGHQGRLVYRSDPPSCDQWRSPAETMRRGGGDCEDLTIIAMSVATGLRMSADVMVGEVYDKSEGWQGHAWLEGVDQQGWFLLEATNGTIFRYRPAIYRPLCQMRPGNLVVFTSGTLGRA